MRAVLMAGTGGVEVLRIGEHVDPVSGSDDLLIRVRATALNRADLLRRRGLYSLPKGASEVLGLEMAGEVIAAGSACEGWTQGDRVCALLPGGGYAELAAVPAGMAMRPRRRTPGWSRTPISARSSSASQGDPGPELGRFGPKALTIREIPSHAGESYAAPRRY